MQRGTVAEISSGNPLPFPLVASLLDVLDHPLLVAERAGKIVIANLRAKQRLQALGIVSTTQLNLFHDLLHMDPKVIFTQMESGEQELNLPLDCPSGKALARIQWLPEPD